MIIAGHQKRQEFSRLTPSIISQICNALRHPDLGLIIPLFIHRCLSSIICPESSMGQNIYRTIIPLVDHLRHLMPLEMSTMFSPTLLKSYKLKSSIRCDDLDESDSFFNAITTK